MSYVDSYNTHALMLIACFHNAVEEGDDDEAESCLIELADMGLDPDDIDELLIESGLDV